MSHHENVLDVIESLTQELLDLGAEHEELKKEHEATKAIRTIAQNKVVELHALWEAQRNTIAILEGTIADMMDINKGAKNGIR